MALLASSAQAATVPLGTAANFAVLAGSTVTNAGSSVITGDVGVSPGSAVTGFGPGEVVPPSVIYRAGPIPLQAQNDLTTAYNTAAGLNSSEAISTDLAGRTLAPGVYTATSSLSLNGTLTLDANGDPNAVFVFQAGSTLLVGTTTVSSVLLINGAQASNVFWQVGSSATIGVGSAFAGNILALTSITMDTNATLNGRALARNGAVTLDSTTINTPVPAITPPPPPPPPGGGGGGGSCAVANPGGLASNNGVVLGENLTGDPAHGGKRIATEWLQLGLELGAETVRRETSDGIITTRTDVPCVDGGSSSTLHPEVQEMTLPSRDGSIQATFSSTQGGYLGDPNVPQPSDLEDSVLLAAAGVRHAASGSEASVLGSWQTPPPGHGSTYERYDAPDGEGADSEWVDATTGLPLKLTVQSGSTSITTYWTYDSSLIDPATLPADFFLLSTPADPAQNVQDDSYPGGLLPGSVTDSNTGVKFTPLSLGPSMTVDGQQLCLASASLYRDFETGKNFADPQDSWITRVDTSYESRAQDPGCAPGHGDASNPAVQVMTFAKASAIATANHKAFENARIVHASSRLGPLSVRVMLGGGQETLALVDIGDSTLLIRSDLPLANSPGAATAQILALLARVGPSTTAEDSSLLAQPGSPAMNALMASAIAPRASAGSVPYQPLTYGDWLFSGSLYNQSAGIPQRANRLDPVSVTWDGGGTASITNVRDYTQTYWSKGTIPHGYPGGSQMKPRDSDPLCRDAHGVFFRRSGTNPNDGKWEQSDPHGFMSTSGTCTNQYHIRMWSSLELYDLTGAHLLQFVLAPIHHDHVYFKFVCHWVGLAPVCYPSIKHGRPDLSFDKARYAYAKVMSYSLCTFIHWKVNPESEGYSYQDYVYSGWVSRITFWLKAQHPTCRGV